MTNKMYLYIKKMIDDTVINDKKEAIVSVARMKFSVNPFLPSVPWRNKTLSNNR